MDESLPKLVWNRARSICEYCHISHSCDSLPFQVDHIIARKHDGKDSADNLALTCFTCNNRKGTDIAGLDPETHELTRLFNPREDNWTEHFVWRGAELHGKTAIGRTTVRILRINLAHRVEVRASLLAEGRFAF